jgi:arylmalonate decarboxylase
MMAPEGVSIHASRLDITKSYSSDSPIIVMSSVRHAAQLLKMIDSSVVVFGCTSSSFMENEEDIKKQIEDETGAPAITSAGAIIEALRTLDCHRIALATPYPKFINEKEKIWLESSGFKVLDIRGLGLGKNESEIRSIGRQPSQIAYEIAALAAQSSPDCVFISCGNFATAPIIESLECDFGISVVTSSQASLWYALRVAGFNIALDSYGNLMKRTVDIKGNHEKKQHNT